MKETPPKLKPFRFFGLTLSYMGDQAASHCPFCEKDEHLFISIKTGQWDCKRCHESGNIYTFLNRLIEVSLERTQVIDYSWLCGHRSLTTDVLQSNDVCRSFINENWLIATRNSGGKIVNIHQFFLQPDGSLEARATPTCKHHLYRTHTIDPKLKPLYIMEGHWDTLAMVDILSGIRNAKGRLIRTSNRKRSLINTANVVGMPGVFKEEFLPLLDGHDVILCTDNDMGGKALRKRVSKLVVNSAVNSVNVMNWRDTDELNDIRDLIKEA